MLVQNDIKKEKIVIKVEFTLLKPAGSIFYVQNVDVLSKPRDGVLSKKKKVFLFVCLFYLKSPI